MDDASSPTLPEMLTGMMTRTPVSSNVMDAWSLYNKQRMPYSVWFCNTRTAERIASWLCCVSKSLKISGSVSDRVLSKDEMKARTFDSGSSCLRIVQLTRATDSTARMRLRSFMTEGVLSNLMKGTQVLKGRNHQPVRTPWAE